jgi:hypothetical protein
MRDISCIREILTGYTKPDSFISLLTMLSNGYVRHLVVSMRLPSFLLQVS